MHCFHQFIHWKPLRFLTVPQSFKPMLCIARKKDGTSEKIYMMELFSQPCKSFKSTLPVYARFPTLLSSFPTLTSNVLQYPVVLSDKLSSSLPTLQAYPTCAPLSSIAPLKAPFPHLLKRSQGRSQPYFPFKPKL